VFFALYSVGISITKNGLAGQVA